MAIQLSYRWLGLAALLCLQPLLYAANPVGVPKADSTEQAASIHDIQGIWVWRRDAYETESAQDRLLAFCKQHGFNRILLQIHTKAGWKDPESKQSAELALPDALRSLLKKAKEQGIQIEALDGAKDMAMKENWPRTLAILDAILEFNRSQPVDERFVGVHYDIEPYIMPEWKTDARETIMLDYLNYLKMARDIVHAESPRLLFSADIPMWYDRKVEDGDSCIVEFDGQVKNLHEHVQDICDYIGIMSYRQHATGRNSVVDHVTAELDYAEKIGKTVCPALETIELKDEPTITFFGKSADEFRQVKGEVEGTLRDRPGFGGMLVHSYDGLQLIFGEAGK